MAKFVKLFKRLAARARSGLSSVWTNVRSLLWPGIWMAAVTGIVASAAAVFAKLFKRLAARARSGLSSVRANVRSLLWPGSWMAAVAGIMAGAAAVYVSRNHFYWIFSDAHSRPPAWVPLVIVSFGAFLFVSHGVALLITLIGALQKKGFQVLIGSLYIALGVSLVAAFWPAPRHTVDTSGGIAIFTSNVEDVKVTVLDRSDDYKDPGRILELKLEITSSSDGVGHLALVTTGDMRAESVSVPSELVVGVKQPGFMEGSVFDYIVGEIPAEMTKAPLPASRDGIFIDRQFRTKEVIADWYENDAVVVHRIESSGTLEKGKGFEFGLLLRTADRFSRDSDAGSSGDLGQIGCASDLLSRSASFSDGRDLGSLVEIPVKDSAVVWTAPALCEVSVKVGEVRGAGDLTVAGKPNHDGRIVMEAVSHFPATERFVSRQSHLTVADTSWSLVPSDPQGEVRLFLSSLWPSVGLAFVIAGLVAVVNVLIAATGVELPTP